MRILLVVDYSLRTDQAVAALAEQRWPPDTIVRVLSVAENVPPSAAELWFDAGGSLEDVLRARKEKSEELVSNIAGLLNAKGFTTETVVRHGRVRKAIAAEAKTWPADKVIVASRWQRSTKRTEGNTQLQ